jgi:hypothetical protein
MGAQLTRARRRPLAGTSRGSRPVSRLLCPRNRGWRPSIWDRRCRRPHAVHQGASTGPASSGRERPVRPLLDLAPGGVCQAGRSPGRWCALTAPFHPCRRRRTPETGPGSTLAADGEAAVCSLWHFPAGHPDWPLASTPPCGGRTFLDPGEPGSRPPGRLPLHRQYATDRPAGRATLRRRVDAAHCLTSRFAHGDRATLGCQSAAAHCLTSRSAHGDDATRRGGPALPGRLGHTGPRGF